MAATVGGLAPKGTLMILGAAQSLTFPPLAQLMNCSSIRGWYSGIEKACKA